MTKFAEVVFETGNKSVLSYDNEDEVKGFVQEHHRRAVMGEPGAPQNQVERTDLNPADFTNMPSIAVSRSRPAERVSRVFLYDDHPGDYNASQLVDVKELQTAIEAQAMGGQVSAAHVAQALANVLSPVKLPPPGEDPLDWQNKNRHESQYKAQETGEMDLNFLDDVEAGA